MQRNDNTPREERTFRIGDKATTPSGLPPTDDELHELRETERYKLTTDQAEALARHLVRNVELEDDNLARLLLLFRAVCYAVGNDSEVLLYTIQNVFAPHIDSANKAIDTEVFDRLRAVKYRWGIEARKYVTGIEPEMDAEE